MKPWMLSLEEFAEIFLSTYDFLEFKIAANGIVHSMYSLYKTDPGGFAIGYTDETLLMESITYAEHKKKMDLIESAMNL